MNYQLATVSEIIASLGTRLRAQRLAQNLSQAEVAQMAGVSPATIKRIEKRGQGSLEAWISLLKALGLVSELEGLFVHEPLSIAQMERAAAVGQRQRASRRERS